MPVEKPGIEVKHVGGIAILYFNNPAKHNAMTLRMWQETTKAFQEFHQQKDIKVIIMAGAGQRAFVSVVYNSESKEKRNNTEAVSENALNSDSTQDAMKKRQKHTITLI